MGYERYRSQEIVGAHIQEYGHSRRHQEQKHLHQGSAHYEQDDKDKGKAYQHHLSDSLHHKVVTVNLHYGLVSEIVQNLFFDAVRICGAGNIEAEKS